MWKEFKKFAMRGSVIDLAIGVVVGGAFSTVVNSLVNDIIMPIVGSIVGKVDFSNLYINLSGGEYNSLAEAKAAGAATINYGLFINNIINFLIIAFSIFIVIKYLNKLKDIAIKKNEEEVVPESKTCPFCYTDIHINAQRCPHCTSIVDTENAVG